MARLSELIGVESELAQVSNALRELAQELAAPTVGAYQVSCSDEAERECTEAFQRWFVREMLPPLKFDDRSAFRSINLGGRYESGAIQVAEQHFAARATPGDSKLLAVKIDSHVGVQLSPKGHRYGQLERYGRASTCCGALAELFEDSSLPAVKELHETFQSGGVNRLASLRDPNVVDVEHRALFAAVVNARLQADRVVAEIRQYAPHSPTVFLVLPCVTINRPGPDSEIVVGEYGIDRTGERAAVKYRGLGDDPAAYRLSHQRDPAVITDNQWPAAS